MEIGKLWFDHSGLRFATRVHDASRRHDDKFARPPNRCYVNPASLGEGAKAFSLNLSRSSPAPPHSLPLLGGDRRTKAQLNPPAELALGVSKGSNLRKI